MSRRIEGTVLRRKCSSCGDKHFDFEFSGDTDMATEGLVAATSHGYAVVGLREAGSTEWPMLLRGDSGLAEGAFQQTFGGPGWRLPQLLRWEQDDKGRMRSVHACLACPDGQCLTVERVQPREFEGRGGRILLGDGLSF